MPKKSRRQKTPEAKLKVIQARQHKCAKKKKAAAKAHGYACCVASQHEKCGWKLALKADASMLKVADDRMKLATQQDDKVDFVKLR